MVSSNHSPNVGHKSVLSTCDRLSNKLCAYGMNYFYSHFHLGFARNLSTLPHLHMLLYLCVSQKSTKLCRFLFWNRCKHHSRCGTVYCKILGTFICWGSVVSCRTATSYLNTTYSSTCIVAYGLSMQIVCCNLFPSGRKVYHANVLRP